MKKQYVVYTVLTGNYEDLLQPAVVDDRFDYVLFSNDYQSELGVWTLRSIPPVVENDNKRLSRYPKTHPETLLSDYHASLYIDANIQIKDQWVYDRFVELYEQQVEYAGIKLVLTGRDCIYEHAFDMCQWYVEYDHIAINQCHKLYELGFPRHYGLNENNVIYRLHTDKIKNVDEEWWMWIQKYSSRDQLSLMYCLWKYAVGVNYFLPVGEDARNGQHFQLEPHNELVNVKRAKTIKAGFLRKLYVKSKSFKQERSLNRWLSICQSRTPLLRLYVDAVLTVIASLPNNIHSLFEKINNCFV